MQSEPFNSFDEQTLDSIACCLEQQGYIVLTQALNNSLLDDLQKRVQQLAPNQWHQAGVGRNQEFQVNTSIRSDKIAWIDPEDSVELAYLNCMETLRHGINRRLYLGLFDYECHFALYPDGACYQKHLDVLKGDSNRVLSTVLYLNDQWGAGDGGELLIYSKSSNKPVQSVLPQSGTLVIFLSEQIPHQVIIARRQRYSIAGWFRLNPGHSKYVEPAC